MEAASADSIRLTDWLGDAFPHRESIGITFRSCPPEALYVCLSNALTGVTPEHFGRLKEALELIQVGDRVDHPD